jgi:hypothetical protein
MPQKLRKTKPLAPHKESCGQTMAAAQTKLRNQGIKVYSVKSISGATVILSHRSYGGRNMMGCTVEKLFNPPSQLNVNILNVTLLNNHIKRTTPLTN